MKQILRFATAITLIATLLTACTDEPKPAPTVIDKVKRTVLVYMVARNNLDSYSTDDIKEMQQAACNGAFGNNRLLLFHSHHGEKPALKEIGPDGNISILKTYDDNLVAVKKDVMRTVIDDAKTFAPADNYGIILWSHGTGWMQTGIEKIPQKRSFGDDRGLNMNVTALAKALDDTFFDFVYFDCCFMGGVEVAYELRNITPKVVASVSELPSPGMPYHLTLPYLMADIADVEGAATQTFNHYNSMTGWKQTCTMSVIETAALPQLAADVKKIYAEHPALENIADVQQFVDESRKSFHNRYFDLQDYLDKLTSGKNELRPYYENAVNAIKRCAVYKNSTPYLWKGLADEVVINTHCGISTFIINSRHDAETAGYYELAWFTDVASSYLQQ